MIKIIVAEDEIPLLRGISTLIEKLDPDFQVVMMARTGKAAIDYLEDHNVDIIFTDINMPVVDGLQVLNYVKREKPQIIRVIISGYQDFSYAQQAVKYEAKRYLTKPIDKRELYALLQELKAQVVQDKEKNKDMLLKQEIFGRNSSFHVEKDVAAAKENVAFGRLRMVYVVAKAYCTGDIEEDVFPRRFWETIDLDGLLKAEAQTLEKTYFYPMKHSNEIVIILEGGDGANVESAVNKLFLMKQLQFPLAVAISNECVDVSSINKTIKQLQAQIRENWRYGISEVVHSDRPRKIFHISKATEESLQYMIRQGSFDGFQDILFELQRRMEEERITQYDLEITFKKIFLTLQTCNVRFANGNLEKYGNDINGMIIRANSLKEVFEEFIVWCHNMMFSKTEANAGLLVERLDAYIRENYIKRINTKMLAQEFGLVPSYLSKLFREYKGITPNHYIQAIRIEKSKEILAEHPSILTKDISSMVGYEDPSYFSKVFKKSTGVYPSEYRNSKLLKAKVDGTKGAESYED